jgi:hypothetical protein
MYAAETALYVRYLTEKGVSLKNHGLLKVKSVRSQSL